MFPCRLSIFLMIIITERTDRPFATSLFSKKSFIKGRDEPVKNRTDTFDMSVSRQGLRSDEDKGATVTHQDVVTKDDIQQSVYDRSLIVTPTSAGGENAVPTVPTLTEMSEWRQKRDTALRTTMRVDDVRSQAVPSPLTAVYGPATPPSRESVKQYGSHFSWRPPTRDSTLSQSTSQDLEEYHNNWPPAAMQQEPKSPNRASAPPPSEPPSVPLPPLMPPPEGASLAETANEAEAADIVEATPESKRSSDTVSTPPEPDSTGIPDPQPVPAAKEEATGTPVEESPVEEAPRPRGRRPALPSLEKLSARAAARHNRTSMLLREAELKSRPSADNSTDDATKADSARSSPEETETSRTDITKPRDYKLETDDSGFESEDDDTGPEEPRRSRRSLLRSNTAGPRLVRNFSRPRVPSGLLRHRRPSEGTLPAIIGSQQWRRSRSMPPARSRRDNKKTAVEHKRNNVIEVDSEFEPTVPILQPAPVPVRQQTKLGLAAAGPTSQDASPSQQKPRPRLTPFPSAATSMAPEKKVRGLGQGSLRQLETRVTQWCEGVDPTQVRLDAQTELDVERHMMEELDARTSVDIQEGGGSGGRRSMEQSRGRQANKLSREKSSNVRARRAAQNF